MNKAIPIVILLIILGVVGATYMTSDSTDSSNMGFEDTVTILNDSEDIEEVNVAEIGEELNKNKEVVKTDNSSIRIPVIARIFIIKYVSSCPKRRAKRSRRLKSASDKISLLDAVRCFFNCFTLQSCKPHQYKNLFTQTT